MEILQLRYFCSAAESENFSSTASRFRVPPSDISQSIKRLERELDTPLFVRSANRVRLSHKGREFYLKISRILQQLDSAVEELTAPDSGGQLKIQIGSIRRIAMQALERFRTQYPHVDIVVQHSYTAPADDFDLIITTQPPDPKDYGRTRLLSEKLCLAVRRDSNIAKSGCLSAEALSKEAFVSMTAGTPLFDLTREVCARLGFNPHIAIQSDDPYYVRKCVEMGLGVTIVPAISWRGQFSGDTLLLPLAGEERHSYICSPINRIKTQSSEAFVRILAEECRKEMESIG
ncbi:MAG: LysR family transcriptional regulator [Clostridia bacterium]|nr:LysR family transcriptional regulator [Clostridia bacterium]